MGLSKNESRKFIDLLLKPTNNRWANIGVSTKVSVGDFGRVERSTGEFIVEGNLYKHKETRQVMKDYPCVETAAVQYESYTSEGVTEVMLGPTVTTSVVPITDVSFTGSWAFKREKGAVLLMMMPKNTKMDGFPTSLLKSANLLNDRVICTSVVSCPAFVLYLGNAKDHTFEVSLMGSVPVPSAPGLMAGGGLSTSWRLGGVQGTVKEGVNDQYVFYPLFSLKRISKLWGYIKSVPGNDQDALAAIYSVARGIAKSTPNIGSSISGLDDSRLLEIIRSVARGTAESAPDTGTSLDSADESKVLEIVYSFIRGTDQCSIYSGYSA